MGFPDDFVFKGNKTEIAKQIGNAVPPDLAGAIGAVVKDALDAMSVRQTKRTTEARIGAAVAT